MITEREKQVFDLYQKTGSYNQVAKSLGVSYSSVKGAVRSFELKKKRLTNSNFDNLTSYTRNTLSQVGIFSLDDVMTKDMAFFDKVIGFGKLSRLELIQIMETSGYNVDGILKKDWSQGGNREGSGRPPIAEGERSVVFTMRMTPSQRSKLESLGGAEWIRKQISAA